MHRFAFGYALDRRVISINFSRAVADSGRELKSDPLSALFSVPGKFFVAIVHIQNP
jgi:hypothetical protein